MPPKSSSAVLPTRRTLRTTARKANPIPTPKTLNNSPPASASHRSAAADKPTTTTPSPPVPSLVSPSSNKRTPLASPQTAGNQLNLNPKPTRGRAAANVLNSSPNSDSGGGANVLNLNLKSTSVEDGNELNLNPKSTSGEGVNVLNLNPESTCGDAAADVLNLSPKSTTGEGISKGNQKPKSTRGKAEANLNLNPKSTSGEGINVLNLNPESSSSEDADDVLNLNPKSTSGEGVSKDNQKPKSSTQTASMELKCNPKSSSSEEYVSIDPPSVEICADETLIENVKEARPVAVETKSVSESGFETAPAATKKTVMKKTVRVVKRVVKKKVPKKEQIASSNDESQNLESSKDGEMPDSSVSFNDMELKSFTTPVESVSMEIEKDNPIDTISPEIENLRTDVIYSMGSEKTNDDADIQMNAENEEDIKASVSDILSEDPAVIKNENSSEPTVSDYGGNKTENASEPTVSESEAHLEDQNDECETENVKSESQSDEEHEEVKEEVIEDIKVVVNDSKTEVGPSDAILMSGELEALERRRKRKTEIFVGGLEKEAKEEDIRKIFGQVGEITEVRIVFNSKTGKNKGFAFVRFASAADAKNALTKYPSVQICGKQCGVSANEGNDTLFLGNINKKLKTEDVIKILKDMGIEKIDKVTVMPDPNKIGWNRGFAFLELETNRDAQIAYNKLQNKDLLGKNFRINVAWADPLIEPDEDEILKLKSVYAEYLPISWDEEKVTDYFKRFGEIENVTLAKNLRNSKRKDFAFVKYTTREAAIACIEAFSRDQLNDEDSKLKVRVSLAKPLPKAKQIKYVSNPARNEFPQEKRKPSQTFTRPREPMNKGKITSSSNYGDIRGVVESSRSSTNSELVHLLRQQASWRQPEPLPPQGPVVDLDRSYPSPARKRPFYGDDTRYSDPRGYPRPRFESSYPTSNPSAFPQSVGTMPLPRHHQQVAGYTPEPFYRVDDYPSYIQRREPAPPYHGSNVLYRRY